MMALEGLQFLTPDDVKGLATRFGTPVYVYDERRLRNRATQALRFPHAFGLTVRYAMKANPNAAILRMFADMGLHFDASSGFEACRAIKAGIPPHTISLSSQELAPDFEQLANEGAHFVATSLRQLNAWGSARPGSEVSIRFNPGRGSGENNRTNVGGPTASFGIWYELAGDVAQLLQQYELTLTRIHTHIGSGSDPAVWQNAAQCTLALVERFETVQTMDLGGGYKVGRMANEESTDLQAIGVPVRQSLRQFAKDTGRQLHLEIEPGGFLVAEAGTLVATVDDVVSTGEQGYTFIRANTGMSDILRPMLYGAQHPIVVVPRRPTSSTREYVVVGHCCESGDLLTPAARDPERIATRPLTEAAAGDLLVIEAVGAYCSALAGTNYNSFPVVPEVMKQEDGSFRLIRRRQTLDEMIALEE